MNCRYTCQLYLSFFDLCEEEDISFDGEFLTVWHFAVHGSAQQQKEGVPLD
jgi:hypothetical protein